ncbi:radical SAM protein [Nitrosomonas sp. Nm34]|uniref:radical SAM protein n=1 Tax=Nitrosomonas sp. Nm34 TaxID=1881055 RepID=UPI001587F345|nr:radical SAM protein [Nitrosomonas sp. Nm34]
MFLGGVLVQSIRQLTSSLAGAALVKLGAQVAGYDAASNHIMHLSSEWAAADAASIVSWATRGREPLGAFLQRFAMGTRPQHLASCEVLVFATASYLLRIDPRLDALLRRALRTSIACAGTGDGSLYAVAVSLRELSGHERAVPELLRRLTSKLAARSKQPAAGVAVEAWESIETSGPELSPTMAGSGASSAVMPFDAPAYLNIALAEAILHPAHRMPIDGNVEQLHMALVAQRETSAARWIFNELLNVVEHRSGQPQPDSIPSEIHIALSGLCNLECRFCSYSHNTARKDQASVAQMMKLDFLRDIRILRLHSGNGESTVNRGLADIVGYIGRAFPQISMNFFTNGILLDRAGLIPALVGSQLAWISVSLNAATPELWARLCGTKQFERVTRNLRFLLEEKRHRKSFTPVLYGTMVLTRESVYELPLMPRLCRQLGVDRFTAIPFFSLGYDRLDRLGPNDAYHHVGSAYDEIYARTVEAAEHWQVSVELPAPAGAKAAAFGIEHRQFLDFANSELHDSRLEKLLISTPLRPVESAPCHYLWRQASIGISEKYQTQAPGGHYMYPCLGPLATLNLAPHTPFDFPQEKGFKTLWRNPLFSALRRGQLNPGQEPVCDTCRGCDTRDPQGMRSMQVMLDEFVKNHGLHVASPVAVSGQR